MARSFCWCAWPSVLAKSAPGYTALPRWSPGAGLEIDWVADDEIEVVDPRVVKRKADGLVRLTFISHLRVVRCGDGRSVSEITDVRFLPESDLEEFGVEDPRITALDGRYYFTYVSVSRHGAGTALASTTDFKSFERHGMIFCPENKDVVLFPERIGGEYVALHRPNAATPFCRPEMWVARSPDLIHWGAARMSARRRCRLGDRPRRCGHAAGAHLTTAGSRFTTATASPRNRAKWACIQPASCCSISITPRESVGRTATSIFEPTADFERHGFVPDVVFPTGIIETEGSYLIYYGAADSCTAVVEFSPDERS